MPKIEAKPLTSLNFHKVEERPGTLVLELKSKDEAAHYALTEKDLKRLSEMLSNYFAKAATAH